MLRGRGSELEAGFAFGVVRQLFERPLAGLDRAERDALLDGPAAATGPLWGEAGAGAARDTSFAVLHGLYWLAANMAAVRPVLVVVDDAHWADGPSLHWLAYLAPRLPGLTAGLLVGVRPTESASGQDPLLCLPAPDGNGAALPHLPGVGSNALADSPPAASAGADFELRFAPQRAANCRMR